MQENDFEKQVYKKMGELHLLPSEAVWEQVEIRLHRKEKRRRWIIWVPLLLAGISLFGYLYYPGHIIQQKKLSISTNGASQNFGKIRSANNVAATSTANPIHADDKKIILSLKKINDKIKDSAASVGIIAGSLRDTRLSKPGTLAIDRSALNESETSEHAGVFVTEKKNRFLVAKKSAGKTTRQTASKFITESAKEENTAVPGSLPNAGASAATNQVSLQTKADAGNDMEPVQLHEAALAADQVNTSLISIKENHQIKIESPHQSNKRWEWGLSFEAGRSSLTTGSLSLNKLFSAASYNFAAPSQSLSTGNGNPSPNAIYYEPYPTRAAIGFSAGVFVKKHLSKKFSLSLGINYTQYSTTTSVGTKVDSAIQSNTFGNLQTFNQYFRTGNVRSYTNRYHYIELPVLLQTRLTNNSRLPLFWDFGFSFSKLIASNALHFNNRSGIYYKDNTLLNKTQFNIVTGFPLKLSSGKLFALQAGPQLQYGFNHVGTNDNSLAKHFLFLGLKANLVFGKK